MAGFDTSFFRRKTPLMNVRERLNAKHRKSQRPIEKGVRKITPERESYYLLVVCRAEGPSTA